MTFANISKHFRILLLLITVTTLKCFIKSPQISRAEASALLPLEHYPQFSLQLRQKLQSDRRNSEWFLEGEYWVRNSDSNPFVSITLPDNPRRSSGETLFSLLQETPDYSTFASLLNLANLTGDLSQENLVVFVPKEKAWEDLGENARELIQPENREQLIRYLKNYIVVGGISDAQYQQGLVQTMGDQTLRIEMIEPEKIISVNGVNISRSAMILNEENKTILVPVDQLLFQP